MTTQVSYLSKAVGTTPVTLNTFTMTSAVTGVQATNILTQTCTVDVYVTRSGVDYYLAKGSIVPPGSPFIIVGSDIKHFMLNGDSLKIVSSVASSIDVIVNAALGV